MEITAITPQVKDKTRCSIYVDGRFYCGLTLETTVKNRLKVGQSVTEQFLSEIQLESEKTSALDKALTHITATQKTEREIRSFLTKKGYLPATVEYVLEKLRGYDFVNDGEYAKAYVASKSKRKGERLIELELRAKGISETDAEEALSLKEPVLIECVIDPDEKVWPMVAPGAAIGEVFTEEDLKKQ